jgi:hypothetical protein
MVVLGTILMAIEVFVGFPSSSSPAKLIAVAA